jgi:hypothetical protein
MPRLWGPPLMMYPPWVGWYGPWTPPPMHFHLGWLGLASGFGHRGYHTRDGHYTSVGQQQTRQANRTIQNAKPDHLVPPETTEAPGQPHKQSMRGSEDARRSGGNRDQTGPRSETSADDEAKHSTTKVLEEIAEKQNKAQGEEIDIRAEAVVSF